MTRTELINYLEEQGIKKGTYRLRFYECSPYQKRYKPEFRTSEAWLYQKEIIKHEKHIFKKGQEYRLVDKEGNPIMESASGLLITATDFKDKEFMETMLSGFK